MAKAKKVENDEPSRKPLVYSKKTRKIPDAVIERCRQRLKQYDAAVKAAKKR